MTADYNSAINIVRRPDQRRPCPGEFLTCRSVDGIKGINLCSWADAAVAAGEAEGLDGRRGSVAAAYQRSHVALRVSPRAAGRPEIGSPAVTLLADLDAFFQEHRRCGDLDSAVEDDRVWMSCTCGAVISRTLEPASRS